MPALPNRPLYAARIQALGRARIGGNTDLCRRFGSDLYWFGTEAAGSAVPAVGVTIGLVQIGWSGVRGGRVSSLIRPTCRSAYPAIAMPAPHRTAPAGYRRMRRLA